MTSNSPCWADGCDRLSRSLGLCGKHYWRYRKHGDPHITHTRRMDGATVAAKLEAYADRSAGPSGCWLWMRQTDSSGYGVVYVPAAERTSGGQPQERAHRLAWRLAHATEIPAGSEVLHSCDTPACVNPAHLRIGSHAENMAEMSLRRRASRGDAHPRTKLSDADVDDARRMKEAGASNREIAERFGVSLPYVSRLTRGLRR